jgi:hypothetical protein
MAGHDVVLLEDGDRGRGQLHAQPVADEPGWHAVLVAAHHHLRIPIHPRGEGQRGVERLDRQRPQQRAFERPVGADAVGAVTDPASVVLVVSGFE